MHLYLHLYLHNEIYIYVYRAKDIGVPGQADSIMTRKKCGIGFSPCFFLQNKKKGKYSDQREIIYGCTAIQTDEPIIIDSLRFTILVFKNVSAGELISY